MNDKIKKIIDNIQSKLNDVTVTIQNVVKNNNIQLNGIYIRKNDVNISPVIYIDSFLESGMTIEEISNQVIDIYRKNVTPDFSFVKDIIGNFENVKDKLFIRVINYENNKKMLKNIPHEKFLNLALYSVISLDVNDYLDTSIKVSYDMIKYWQVEEQNVIDISKHNTITYERTNIIELKDILGSYLEENIIDFDNLMYVITNDKKCWGANRIIDISKFDQLAQKINSDLCIIPSSIHELIVFPFNDYFSKEYINNMIWQVNGSEVSEDEVLSDYAYIFRKEQHSFDIL